MSIYNEPSRLRPSASTLELSQIKRRGYTARTGCRPYSRRRSRPEWILHKLPSSIFIVCPAHDLRSDVGYWRCNPRFGTFDTLHLSHTPLGHVYFYRPSREPSLAVIELHHLLDTAQDARVPESQRAVSHGRFIGISVLLPPPEDPRNEQDCDNAAWDDNRGHRHSRLRDYLILSEQSTVSHAFDPEGYSVPKSPSNPEQESKQRHRAKAKLGRHHGVGPKMTRRQHRIPDVLGLAASLVSPSLALTDLEHMHGPYLLDQLPAACVTAAVEAMNGFVLKVDTARVPRKSASIIRGVIWRQNSQSKVDPGWMHGGTMRPFSLAVLVPGLHHNYLTPNNPNDAGPPHILARVRPHSTPVKAWYYIIPALTFLVFELDRDRSTV
ncbi:hypothetical protein JB92DRAFT_2838960 [Gautieria morchelliformis]|nr:hypothetical protein JB92DRAFT_2838960 [Gautieria morchelliformis]